MGPRRTGPSDPDSLPQGARCILCQTPLAGRVEAQGQFCCMGCKTVHQILSTLDDKAAETYLAAARKMGVIPEGDRDQGVAAGAGQPQGERAIYPPDPAAMREERFTCSGLSCPSCSWIIEQLLEASPGVARARVDYFSGGCQVTYDLRRTSAAELPALLSPFGYGLHPLATLDQTQVSRSGTRDFVICAVLLMNIMSLAAVRYMEGLGWLDHAPEFLGWVELLLTLPVLYIGWVPMVRRAVAGVLRRHLTMDFLLATAVVAAALLSMAALITGRKDIYFETAAGLTTISLLSRMIEARLRERAYRDLSGLLRMKVIHVRQLCSDGQECFVGIKEVLQGERVAVMPEELVPFDGEVTGAPCMVSEAVLTGEPTAIRKVAGDPVIAGSLVVEGRLELVVQRSLEQTLLYRIAEDLRRSLDSAASRLRSADKIAAAFVPTVLSLALGVWLIRLARYGLDFATSAEGWFPSVAMLAVACPCAFSLAGVTAITAATGALLRQGFLVKEPKQLEILHRVQHLIFDKTGTLTEGRMEVEHLCWREQPRQELLSMVLALEAGSLHPVAHAIRTFLADQGITEFSDQGAREKIEELPGQGRRVQWGDHLLQVGHEALFAETFALNRVTPRHTVIWFGFDDKAVGCFLITDRLHPGAKAALTALQRLGYSVELVSGDRQVTSEYVAAEVGIPQATGEVTLQRKVEMVRRRRSAGQEVAYIGDGTNDALAMSESTVSVAVARSTDEALAASGFVALRGDISQLPRLFAVGRKLSRVIRTNYLWAFSFNTLFIPVAALGRLTPLAAMLLMLLSSSAVLLNSLRLRAVR